ncbi:phage tail protein [Paenibacillus albicereus]|uniref:Phage tail protein n=1 Tax=Paenibacillus albicereus TaxID=2726185 RepID=A0A6H2H0W1_9BACL|nr:phage tail tube protein [Paenibacillus albicereus]QJC53056.1 phage tail protein [Paenibacillus albicereus]
MAGVLTKDTTLSVKGTGSTYTEIPFLMEVPEIGGEPDQVEVTTLGDSTRKYIAGIKDLGDLTFSFLYDNSGPAANFRVLKAIETLGETKSFRLEYPDGTTHDFDAQVSVKMDSAAVNAALTFTASFYLQSEIAVTDPV